jgi:sec-independent protein translocase protein TatA
MIPEPLHAIAFGFAEILLLMAVIMLLFGAKKLPMLARGVGQSIRNFKGELKVPEDDDEDEDDDY